MGRRDRIPYSVVGPDGLDEGEGGLDDLRRATETLPGAGFLWVRLNDPDGSTVAEALELLGLSTDGVEAAVEPHRRPSVEIQGNTWRFVFKTLWYVEDTRQVETGDFVCYTDGRMVLTVRHGGSDPTGAVVNRISSDEEVRAEAGWGVLYGLLDNIVDRYQVAVEDFEDDVQDLEKEVFSEERTELIAPIYMLMREGLEFTSVVRPLVPFARQVIRGNVRVDELARPGFRDVAEHILRVSTTLDSTMSLLQAVLQAHNSQISLWQNNDMRKISAWAGIIAVPTAVAGVYGMNFTNLPGLHWAFGYPLVLAVMVVICLFMYRGFKRSGWL
ncbi:magnesium and cobalt transport protein CorA [Salininema proteolyticum]|uniref:Magnesium and cobalt transport protein CorA n=1 Tax=Salininema proteolyticum TaxID=1607685 RepID=A0ABV8U0L5_9ACTN